MTRQIIQSYYRAFNARDYAAMLDLVSDEVIHDINQGEREVGQAAFQAFLARMDECYREQLVDLVLIADASGSRFAVEFTVLGKYLKADAGMPAANGQSYSLLAGAFLEVHDDKITRVTTYYNLQDWLAQVEGKSR